MPGPVENPADRRAGASVEVFASTDRFIVVLLLAIRLAQIAGYDADPDIWGKIAYGRDLRAQGRWVPASDIYSYTAAGHRVVDHEWGFNQLAWAVYRLLGWPGLRAWRCAFFALAAWLALRRAARLARRRLALPVIAAVVLLPLTSGFGGPRPQVITYLLFAWLLFCFDRSWERGPRWILAAVAPMPFWVNVHGGFLAGIGAAGLWGGLRLIGAAKARDGRTAVAVLGAGVWCLASLFLNPWGWEFVAFELRASQISRPLIPEWDAPAFPGSVALLLVAMVALAAFKWVETPRRWPDLGVIITVLLAAARHQRHVPFLAIAVGVFAAPAAVEYLNGRFLPRSTPGTGGYRVLRSMRLAAAAGIAVALTVAISLVSRGPPSEPLFPEKAVEAIRRGKLAGGMLVDFDWAQYAIFHLAPDVKVAFDGRYEAVYPAAVVGEYGDWYFGRGSKDILIREPQTRIALVASNSARHRDLRQQPGWTQFYADATAAVLVKDSPDLDKHVGPTTDP